MVDRASDGNGPSDRGEDPRASRSRARRQQRERPRPPGLEIDQDPDFHGRAWSVQVTCWALMALALLAALLGLFGNGPLSRAVAGEPGDLIWIEYQRFGRDAVEDEWLIRLGPGAARDGRARVWIDRSFLEGVRVVGITPEPERVEAGPDRLLYTFPIAEPARATALTFHLRPEGVGPAPGRLGLRDGPTLSFWQFVYP